MKKIIIFDMDGVIVDSLNLARDEVLRLFPGMTEDYFKDMHNENFHEALVKARLAYPQRKESEDEKIIRRKLYSEKKLNALIFPGVINLLENLKKKGYILILNTSASNDDTVPILHKAKIARFFDFIGTSEISKNKTEKFKLIQEKYGTSKDDVLFITDSLGDVREAKEVGIKTIAVTWGVHNKDDFKNSKSENLIAITESVLELESVIELNTI